MEATAGAALRPAVFNFFNVFIGLSRGQKSCTPGYFPFSKQKFRAVTALQQVT